MSGSAAAVVDGGAASAPSRPWTKTLVGAALDVLLEPDPMEKARLGEAAAKAWLDGSIPLAYDGTKEVPSPPDKPARSEGLVRLVPPGQMPKLGKGGSLHSRQSILHSLVHTESWAIDLSWDIIARFGKEESMPDEFFMDFVRVAQDEGRHFTLLENRLRQLGSYYGALPAHDGLWDSAAQTSHSLLARLAIEHCVHEARGLDVVPTTITRFRSNGDEYTANLLETVVYPEEITHCAAGVKWFTYLCLRKSMHCQNPAPHGNKVDKGTSNGKQVDCVGDSPAACITKGEAVEDEMERVVRTFHDTVRRYFRGPLKPPFNEKARKAAGFGPNWYEPLAVKVTMVPE